MRRVWILQLAAGHFWAEVLWAISNGERDMCSE